MEATDYLIECGNPEKFDETIQGLATAVLMDGGNKGKYIKHEGYYVMRVFKGAGFLEFAIKSQGYGKIIKKLDKLL